VVRLRVLRSGRKSPLQRFTCFIPAFLLPVSVPEVFEGDPVVWIELESLLKIPDGLARPPLARGEKPEVVPCIWAGIGIARAEFRRAFEAVSRFSDLLLFQVNASQPIMGLGARWIVAKSKPE